MSRLYERIYRISITKFNGLSISLSDLRCVFAFKKSMGQIAQYGEVTIYNLNQNTETDVFQNAKLVTIEAGYRDGSFGIIFQGNIKQPIRGKENGTDYYLTLGAIDGEDALNLSFVNFTTGAGQLPKQIVEQVVRASNIPFEFEIIGELGEQKSERGQSFFGQPKEILQNIATNNNAAMYSNNGVLTIAALNAQAPNGVPELNFQTGLIGTPAQADEGVTARCLINPDIKLGDWVKLNNKNIVLSILPFQQQLNPNVLDLDGLYRVIGITVTGDTRGDAWYYDLELVSQSGRIPLLASTLGQFGF